MKLCFLKKSAFEMLWYIDLCTCLVKDYDIYYGTKCFDIDRIYALSLTMFQWAPPMEIIRWFSVDPASGGCALVFYRPRQWGLNVCHSQGC